MLFITNRLRQGSERSQIGKPFQFAGDATASLFSVYFCQRKALKDYTEIGSKALLQNLKDSRCKEIVLFIHGYNVLPEGSKGDGVSGGFQTAITLQKLLDAAAPGRYEVVALLWPTDDDLGIVKDYYDDRSAAKNSGGAFARVLSKFMAWRAAQNGHVDACFKRVNVVAHSMGNLLLTSTLANWKELHGGVPRIFQQIFMFAPDVVNDIFEPGQDGRIIAESCVNVSVYYAVDDLAMSASKVANVGQAISKRLGHTGPERLSDAPSNVHAIDCSSFNTDYDSPTGHGYFLTDSEGKPGAAFRHMMRTLTFKKPDPHLAKTPPGNPENRYELGNGYEAVAPGPR